MSNHEHLSESDPSQPDQPYNQVHPLIKIVAELISTGQLDPSTIEATGDGSTLPPKLQEMVQKWLQEQANNGTPPPPDIPPSPETPQ